MINEMENLKQLVEDIIIYTKTWSICENEWYSNVDCVRQNCYGEKHITDEEFERAIREDILYCLIYNIDSIKRQMENDFECGYDSELFEKNSKELEQKIKDIFPTFKIDRY